MNKVKAVINFETRKILARKKTIVLMIISALIPGVLAGLVLTVQNQVGILALGSVDFSIWVLGFFCSIFLPLFIFMWTADSFAGEVEDLSIKSVLLRPVSRFKIYLGKITAILVSIIINLAVVLVFSQLASMFPGILRPATTPGGFGLAAGAYLLAAIPLIFLAIAASFLAQFFKGSSSALIALILLFIIARALPFLSPAAGKCLPTFYLDWYMLWLGSTPAWGQIVNALIFMLGSGIISFALGCYLFDRKEL